MRWIFGHRPPKNPRGWIVRDGDNKLGIVDLGSDASLEVRHLIDRNLHNHGKPFETGGALSTSCLPLLGAGSVAASSLAAGNVFLATANPATLMSIGSGVGSAVMGTGGIVAQAPFIAASTAILPVVAPLAILMTVSSTMLSARFELRIHHGPGYRLYCGKDGDELVILLAGGSKNGNSATSIGR